MASVDVERQGAAGIIRFSNPPYGVMATPHAQEMLTAFRALTCDSSVQTIIITGGQPGIFNRHWDVSEFVAIIDAEDAGLPLPDMGGAAGHQPFSQLIEEIAEAPQPVIAAINGLCMGGGFELALACDLRIADPKVEAIGPIECRVGTHPAGSGPSRLPRIVGEAKALNIILRGLTFTGAEAYEMGLVTELADDPVAHALEISRVWEGRVSEGLANAKRLIRSAFDRTLAEGVAEEGRLHGEVISSPAVRKNLRRLLPPADIRDL
ncbi:Fatty acid oxidation complex subunit alpha (plasmid) [Sphingobium sp. AntQ-1]|uniref:enoyl-CoA hydratase/isomerase family protein n=1 Tax=Sphingobium sp. AntQ-1 TaxID=2930091 RepID=UPI00234FA0FA|nr:enoyl-CoA hydratase/isomerase family protein [Sphingobium sp. AntQ-1]WCP15964.1 Fatty acid oxidation complex subunit alpha [Sphingobium sp. AntQ-1]